MDFRYEALILNGANGSTDYVRFNDEHSLGGYYCSLAMISNYLDGGCICAIVKDITKDETFCLFNIEW